MGNTGSAPDPVYCMVQDTFNEQVFTDFYDDLQSQFGDDLSGAFLTALPSDPSQIPDLDLRTSVCEAAIRLDRRIAELRYRLVPGRISESHFWIQFLIRFDEFIGRSQADLSPNQDQTQKMTIAIDGEQPRPGPDSNLNTTTTTSLTSDLSDSTDTQISLLTLPEVFVYQVPARQNAQGHYAQNWALEKPLWTGALRLISLDGFIVFLRLYDPGTDQVFANSDLIDLQQICRRSQSTRSARLKAIQTYIEPTLDTSRYFVVRFKNPISGQLAFLGIGFRHRSTAFDLNASILDQLSKCERYLNLESNAARSCTNTDFHNSNDCKDADQNIDCNREKFPVPDMWTLPSLSLDEGHIPAALSPPKQPVTGTGLNHDEDDDSFGCFLSASLQGSNSFH